MKMQDYFLEAIKTGSVLIPENEIIWFADYLLKMGRRKDFFFRDPVDGIVEVLY